MALIQGWDGMPDYEEANYWVRQSIDNRSDIDPMAYSESQYQLGRNLVAGRGTARDIDEGMRLILASAAARNPRAQTYLKMAGRASAAKSRSGKAMPGRKPGTGKGRKAPAARKGQR